MKFLAGTLFIVMLSFAGVQWNDPDGPLWAMIYAIPAVLMALVILRPRWLATAAGKAVLACVLIGFAIATIIAWPEQAAFWTRDVWWEEETAREGMGMMIALLVSAVALPAAFGRRPDHDTAATQTSRIIHD